MPNGPLDGRQSGEENRVVPQEQPLDPAVVTELYLEFGDELQRFLIGLLRDAHLASDALQATFTKLVEKGGETRAETRKGWLFRVAYHEAMHLRRRMAVGDKVIRTVAWDKPSQLVEGDDPLVQSEAVEGIKKALVKLPPDQRQIVYMRIFEEKTFAVIADELKIPLGTALGRMRTALMKLRLMLVDPDSRNTKNG